MNAQDSVRSIVHGCVCFAFQNAVVWVDPYLIRQDYRNADLIIITHSHSDHYSPRDILRAANSRTHFITNADTAAKLASEMNIAPGRITVIDIGSTAEWCGITVRAVPAVNKNHPAGFGFGAVLCADGFTYYLSGDTDTLCDPGACDILFCVCDGVWNMPDYLHSVPHDILKMHRRPGLCVPYHYGADHPQSAKNGKALCEALAEKGIPAKEWPF